MKIPAKAIDRGRWLMKTTITGFHQDEESQWVADLGGGHTRHFRHHPPWQKREWVILDFFSF